MFFAKLEYEDTLIVSISLRRSSFVGLIVAAFAAIGSKRARGSPPLDNYLRRDIGLPPIERSREWWEFR
jgi:hypothetical protein